MSAAPQGAPGWPQYPPSPSTLLAAARCQGFFRAASGNRIVVSYGASNALAKQIEAGAPADLFISADLEWIDYLDRKQLLMAGTRVDLLRNTLVLIAPAASKTPLLARATNSLPRRR